MSGRSGGVDPAAGSAGSGSRLTRMLDDARLARMARELADVDGVEAVVLGGSRARGTHRPDSDVDVGLYYDRARLDTGALERLAREWAGQPVDVAPPGGWGPWVDGGAWLNLDGIAVDWILRDLARVEEQCRRAGRGEFDVFTQPGHPFGFLDVAYAGEVAVDRPLAGRTELLDRLRALVTPYPTALRDALIHRQWQFDFLLDSAVKAAKAGDVAYVMLCATNAVMIAAHAWHALAGSWVTNEKALVTGVARLELDTHGFADAAARGLSSKGRTPEELRDGIATIRALPRPSQPGVEAQAG